MSLNVKPSEALEGSLRMLEFLSPSLTVGGQLDLRPILLHLTDLVDEEKVREKFVHDSTDPPPVPPPPESTKPGT